MGTGSSRNQVATPPPAPVPVTTRARPTPVRQVTIEKIVTEDGAEVGKLRPVVRQSSDSIENDSILFDKDLEDIQDLEHTFDSLGIQADSNSKEDPVKEDNVDRLETRWSENNMGWAIRSSSGPQRLDVPSSINLNNNSSKTNFNSSKSAPIKFSWGPKETTAAPDEWIYQKVILQPML